MRPRDTLAENLNRLIESREDYRTPKKLVEASGVSNGTLGRIRNSETGASVDHLEGLAKAFGVQAWELLVPEKQMAVLRHMMEVAALLANRPETDEAQETVPRKRRANGRQ